jgi:hypothetical protein
MMEQWEAQKGLQWLLRGQQNEPLMKQTEEEEDVPLGLYSGPSGGPQRLRLPNYII